MMPCISRECSFYGLSENGGKCSICAGIRTLPENATEADVMDIFGLTDADFPSEAQIKDRIDFLMRLKPQRSSLLTHVMSLFTDVVQVKVDPDPDCWPLIIHCDNQLSVKMAMGVIGLGPRLRVDTCRRIMDIVKKATVDNTIIAFQKALVSCCIAPWLLEGSDDFQVGLCYFGIGNGNMVTRKFLEQLKDGGARRSAWLH